jgi:heme/copper-type cytochrome/quinol oxidase subunit 2
MISPNMNWKYVAERTGKFEYHCIYHPDMTGSIVVVEATAASASRDAEATKATGKF